MVRVRGLEEGEDRRGCLGVAAGGAALVVLSPLALAVRSWRSWRRGEGVRLGREEGTLTTADGRTMAWVDLSADIPRRRVEDARPRLTDLVVRVAEALRREGDVYHLIYRLPAEEETLVLPVGPQLQELGEHAAMNFGRRAMMGRTAVWPVLARGEHLGRLVDVFAYDPEVPGEPEGLLAGLPIRWAMATSWMDTGAATVFRVRWFVPEDRRNVVKGLLDHLSHAFG